MIRFWIEKCIVETLFGVIVAAVFLLIYILVTWFLDWKGKHK